jgi:hypothetical protein
MVSAEQILSTYNQYTKIDYSKNAQSRWKEVYDKSNNVDEKKKE